MDDPALGGREHAEVAPPSHLHGADVLAVADAPACDPALVNMPNSILSGEEGVQPFEEVRLQSLSVGDRLDSDRSAAVHLADSGPKPLRQLSSKLSLALDGNVDEPVCI